MQLTEGPEEGIMCGIRDDLSVTANNEIQTSYENILYIHNKYEFQVRKIVYKFTGQLQGTRLSYLCCHCWNSCSCFH